MFSVIYHILFLLTSLYILLKTIGYGIYEINTIKNKYGGLVVITFSILVTVFANVMFWMY